MITNDNYHIMLIGREEYFLQQSTSEDKYPQLYTEPMSSVAPSLFLLLLSADFEV